MLIRRHLFSFLVVGVAIAAAGCSDSLGVGSGRVQFVLSGGAGPVGVDAPASVAMPPEGGATGGGVASDALDGDDSDGSLHRIASANVTFASLLARNLDGVLVNVHTDPPLPVTVDVMALETGGRQIHLPEGVLPPGSYDQLVVVMTAVRLVTHDGTSVTIEPPGGGWTAIVGICPFTVDEGTTTVALQFRVRHSFLWRENRFHFQPRLSCDEQESDDS